MQDTSIAFFKEAVNQRLTQYLENNLPTGILKQAALHAVLIGGKRLRPALVYAGFLYRNANQALTDQVHRSAMAIEFIHCYSLIHDDLPCMDDDSLRRGEPTTHIKFGEATALLVGDLLQSLAFNVLTNKNDNSTDILPIQLGILSQAAADMVIGQQLDLLAENKIISMGELEQIHSYKTGAMIEASLLLGAVNHPEDINTDWYAKLKQLGALVGLSYQIKDDILDVTQSTDTLGKPAASDLKLQKSTYPSLMGLDAAQQLYNTLYVQILDILVELGSPKALGDLINVIHTRQA